MGYFRFHRSMKLLPGVRLNLSKSGASVSLGVRGARLNLGSKGHRTTVGLPDSGLSYVHQQAWGAKAKKSASTSVSLQPKLTRFEFESESGATDSPKRELEPWEFEPSNDARSVAQMVEDVNDGPRNPHLYAFAQKWYPKLARGKETAWLPQWLAENEQAFQGGEYDDYAFELRRRIILTEMGARSRGVRPKPMGTWEEKQFEREMMAAMVADETRQPIKPYKADERATSRK